MEGHHDVRRCAMLVALRSLITIFDFHVASRGKIHVSKIRGDRQTFGGRNTTCHGACYTWKDDIILAAAAAIAIGHPSTYYDIQLHPTSDPIPIRQPTSPHSDQSWWSGELVSIQCTRNQPEPHRYFNKS